MVVSFHPPWPRVPATHAFIFSETFWNLLQVSQERNYYNLYYKIKKYYTGKIRELKNFKIKHSILQTLILLRVKLNPIKYGLLETKKVRGGAFSAPLWKNTLDVVVSKPNYTRLLRVPWTTFAPSLVATPLKGACQWAKNLKIGENSKVGVAGNWHAPMFPLVPTSHHAKFQVNPLRTRRVMAF